MRSTSSPRTPPATAPTVPTARAWVTRCPSAASVTSRSRTAPVGANDRYWAVDHTVGRPEAASSATSAAPRPHPGLDPIFADDPLARAKDWVNLPDGSTRETNSMPQLGAPERWLELDPASLGQLAQTAAALSPLSLAADGLASPKITEMGVMRSEAPAAPAQSVARLTDGLESRLSEPPAPLQLWPAPADLLSPLVSNSVVEIAVDNGGAVVSARILRRSGVDQADAQALQLARTMRFTPRSQSRTSLPGMQWGRVIVDWQTGTNVAAAPVEAIP